MESAFVKSLITESGKVQETEREPLLKFAVGVEGLETV